MSGAVEGNLRTVVQEGEESKRSIAIVEREDTVDHIRERPKHPFRDPTCHQGPKINYQCHGTAAWDAKTLSWRNLLYLVTSSCVPQLSFLLFSLES